MLRHKKMLDAQARLRNSERAVAVQKQKLEAQLKVNQQRVRFLLLYRFLENFLLSGSSFCLCTSLSHRKMDCRERCATRRSAVNVQLRRR